MSSPVARFTSSRRYLGMAMLAILGASFSAWISLRWNPAWVCVALFAAPAAALLYAAFRPAIEIREYSLRIGKRDIPWIHIRRLDQTGWNVPLIVVLTLQDGERRVVIHAGDTDSCAGLLRHLRRYAREALLDGVPYRQFWREAAAQEPKRLPPPVRYPMLTPEDEEEVERLFRRLKSDGHLEPRAAESRDKHESGGV